MNTSLYGHCDPAWSKVEDVVQEHLAMGGVGGLAVAVVCEGQTRLHLWGGHADAARRRPWRHDTMVCLFSAGKPLAAALVLKLADRGLVELDAPIASYWPAFGEAGKQSVTVCHALAHLAGIPALPSAPPTSVYDREALMRAVERQRPLWPPGTQGCFHSFTYGIIVGELVRQLTGRPFGDCFRQELGGRFAGEMAFSLTNAEQQRCAEMILPPENPLLRMMCDPETELGRSWAAMNWTELNTAMFRSADFPSIAGHASALGLARFYGMMANGGVLDGDSVLRSETVARALTEQWHQFDPFMGAPVRMGLGFMLSSDLFPFTGGASSFAQPGLGGVAGLGDREARLGIGIAVNVLTAGLENPFLDRVTAAVMHCSREADHA